MIIIIVVTIIIINSGSEDIDGILLKEMYHANNEKWKTANDRITETNNNQNAQRKENLQILGNIGSEHHQTRGNKKKDF